MTQENGIPAATARSIITFRSCGFVQNRLSSGTCAALSRPSSRSTSGAGKAPGRSAPGLSAGIGQEDPDRGSVTVDTAKVREWAKEQGIEVKDRGRVPAGVVEQYQTAAGV
ncbi:hypothetical protein EAS64_08760 [Trebonia kvetii]|uniref:Lsr2 DNA-binding domain-containing protein n=1 Tax=Trebonia kvetii TaxID=2480626 RepID=A0A6P2C050_9ACTN|nr:hypothetical protein EAS64_08760 [Trebonia kvetii]